MSYETFTTESSTYVAPATTDIVNELALARAELKANEETISRLRLEIRSLRANHERIDEQVIEFFKENHQQMHSEHVRELCEIMELEIEEEVTYEITVTVNATVKRSIFTNEQPDFCVDDIDISIYNDDEFELQDSSIENWDVEGGN